MARRRTLLPLIVLCAGVASGARAEGPPVTSRLAEHSGRIVVLNFWAAWCGPCKKELPLLGELEREYAGRGVQFVGASTDAREARQKAEALLKKSRADYPIWYGLSDLEMREIGLGAALPATAVFDRDGRRAFRLIGDAGRKRIVDRLEWMLGDRGADPPKELWLPAGVSAGDYSN